MFVANVANAVMSQTHLVATWFQAATDAPASSGVDLWAMFKSMGWLAKGVVGILFIMSGWSIGVMIDRLLAFSAARSQSRAFAPAVAGALKQGNLDEAIKVAERNNKSHLAKVVQAGLMEFRAHQSSTDIPGDRKSTRLNSSHVD